MFALSESLLIESIAVGLLAVLVVVSAIAYFLKRKSTQIRNLRAELYLIKEDVLSAEKEFKADDYEVQIAATADEAKRLGEAGFEHYDTIDGKHLYKKRK